jgi:hypothetical protein
MYMGHLNDGSSVQKHSAGGLYPYVIYARQKGAALSYGVLTPEGEEFDVGLHSTAVQLALNMKEIEAEVKRLTH